MTEMPTEPKKEYLLEKRLKEESPHLHKRMTQCIVILQKMLEQHLTWFPTFTDHSILHSLDVLDYCNRLLGEQVKELSQAECYVLVMSCYLHDVGMGVSRRNFEQYAEELGYEAYRLEHPGNTEADFIRDLHNEFSALMIRQYSRQLFEIPSENLLFSICQVSRGHRRTDLYDEKDYPDLETPDGVIRTSFLASVLRLADEIDVAADRNPELLFDTSSLTRQRDIDAFGTHDSIRTVEVRPDGIVLYAKPIEPRYVPLVEDVAGKIQKTLDYCRGAAQARSDLRITQEEVLIDWIE